MLPIPICFGNICLAVRKCFTKNVNNEVNDVVENIKERKEEIDEEIRGSKKS